MIAGSDFYVNDFGNSDLNDGVWCQSAMNVSHIGSWKLPNGNAVSDDLKFDPIHMAKKSGQVGLLRSSGIGGSPYQGMYTCTIPDENGVNRTLVVWAGANSAYSGASPNCELKISLHDHSLSLQFDEDYKCKVNFMFV